MEFLKAILKCQIPGIKIPLAGTVDAIVEYITAAFHSPLRSLASTVDSVVKLLTVILASVPPLLFLVLAGAFLWWRKGIRPAVFVVLALYILINQGIWNDAMVTLSLVLTSVFFSLIIALPLGILAGHFTFIYKILRPLLDFMQTVPVYIYLIPAVMFFGIGTVPGVVATVIFSFPPPLRLAYLGIREIPKGRIEAGKAFGASPAQMLWMVELPSAMPSIMLGINQCIMMCLSMVVIASMIGVGGLGQKVLYSLNMIDLGGGFVTGLGVVILAITLDRLVSKE